MKTQLITWLLYSSLGMAQVEPRMALIYDIGKTSGPVKFQQNIVCQPLADGQRKCSSQITDADGRVLMTEEAISKGYQMLSQAIEQRQLGLAYSLSSDGKNITMETYPLVDGKRGKATESKTFPIDGTFLTGPVVDIFLADNWDTLNKGSSVQSDFGVFELNRGVSFKFRKIKDGDDFIRIQMRPSNLIFNLLVDPIDIDLDKKTRRVVRYKGRTPLQQMVKGKWKPFDAEIVYKQGALNK